MNIEAVTIGGQAVQAAARAEKAVQAAAVQADPCPVLEAAAVFCGRAGW